MTRSVPAGVAREPRGVLSFRSFRRLWIALSLSSLGDWLSILALTALARDITSGGSYLVQNAAVGGVLILKMAPAVFLGPLAGAVADRLDRRWTMVIGDVARFGLFVSIPLVSNLTWVFVATFLTECIALFWLPAKDASVPNLVPKEKLEQANQFSLFTTYGTAPVAAGLFALLALVSTGLGRIVPFFETNQVDLALYINGVTFLISAVTVYTLTRISGSATARGLHVSVPSVLKTIVEGWRFVGRTAVVRGLLTGMVGAFAAGGAVIGIASVYVHTLGGGNAAYGVLFGALFIGLAFGMFLGPRILRDFSRRRMFGLAIVTAGVTLALIALIPNLVLAVLFTILLGACAGVAYVTGYTLVGLEVDDDVRGRTFAFLQSLIRLVLLGVLAIVPFVSGAIGAHVIKIGSDIRLHLDGSSMVLLLAALVAILVGIIAFRQMDDRRGIPLARDLVAALRGEPYTPEGTTAEPGILIAFEGGEGAGKTTQARLLSIWLRDQGYDVVMTQEPGATKVGMRLRAILLDRNHKDLSPRSEALMYAADRAEHVDSVIRPALRRGAIVITDRFVDSSLAYQGAGRDLPVEEISRLNRWATGGLVPALTIVLDVPAGVGLGRTAPSADRLESEPREFHERVRRGFRALAETEPARYLVVDATRPVEEISREVQDRVRRILPDPVPSEAEAITHAFPAIRD